MLSFTDLHNREWLIDFTDSETVQRVYDITGINLEAVADRMERDPLAAIESLRVVPGADAKYFSTSEWFIRILQGIDPSRDVAGMLNVELRGALEIVVLSAIRVRWPRTTSCVVGILTMNFASAKMALRN